LESDNGKSVDAGRSSLRRRLERRWRFNRGRLEWKWLERWWLNRGRDLRRQLRGNLEPYTGLHRWQYSQRERDQLHGELVDAG
jgi:hypothetical protein